MKNKNEAKFKQEFHNINKIISLGQGIQSINKTSMPCHFSYIKIRDRGDNGEAGEKLKAARASNLCLAPSL